MQSLDCESNFPAHSDECAALVLDTIPLVMGLFKSTMRSLRPAEISVPQFRTMLYLQRNHGASLSEVADFLGLTLPSASKLVDGLVKREYVTRVMSEEDRRRAILTLTAHGTATLQEVRQEAIAQFAQRMAVLSDEERTGIFHAMRTLSRLCPSGREGEVGK